MSERLPYEEQLRDQLNELPQPDENQAWEKMSLLLDEEDEDRIVPPIFLRSCLGWGLLLLAIGAFLWFYFRPHHEGQSEKSLTVTTKQVTTRDHTDSNAKMNDPASTSVHLPMSTIPTKKDGNEKTGEKTSRNEIHPDRTALAPASNEKKVRNHGKATRPFLHEHVENGSNVGKVPTDERDILKPGHLDAAQRKTGQKKKKVLAQNSQGMDDRQLPTPSITHADPFVANGKATNENPVEKIKRAPDTLSTSHQPLSSSATKPDSLRKQVPSDSLVKTKMVTSAADSARNKKKYYFSAGLGLQQQIPVGGQTSTPYNRNGRKGGLADYIPSVYLRFHHRENWFVQTDFRYGAPQSVKSTKYEQNTVIIADSSGGAPVVNRITTTTSLKRTFYHQAPLTFNYYVLRRLYFGTGIMYSRFFGAVTETEINKKDLQTGAVTINKKINQVPATTDSFFTRSQIHLVLQTAYNWKRFYFGMRYTKALQPFLKYLDNNGALQEEKAQSFNVIIRYRIWQTKR